MLTGIRFMLYAKMNETRYAAKMFGIDAGGLGICRNGDGVAGSTRLFLLRIKECNS